MLAIQYWRVQASTIMSHFKCDKTVYSPFLCHNHREDKIILFDWANICEQRYWYLRKTVSIEVHEFLK